MDRDNRWERVSRAYDAMVHARGETAPDPLTAVSNSYGKGETDEFLAPTVIDGYHGARDGDGIFCLNFRADRAREILAAIGAPDFAAFDTGARPNWSAMLGMVEYSDLHNAYMATAFPKRVLVNTLGEWVASHGLTQFRLAETEKYPHVTFFLNGGREAPYPGEDRAMPPSPKVATYDLQPEMSADQVSDHLVAAIDKGYDLPAAIKACEAVDRGLTRALAALTAKGGAMIVTADHGNCEVMIDPVTGGPHTAHTVNPVPVILVGGPPGASLRTGRLADLAPTLLQLMGLPQPPEMTGQTLIA
jgi:2,3-bisphosphoglycerate-independent phosphoglycerate mutase